MFALFALFAFASAKDYLIYKISEQNTFVQVMDVCTNRNSGEYKSSIMKKKDATSLQRIFYSESDCKGTEDSRDESLQEGDEWATELPDFVFYYEQDSLSTDCSNADKVSDFTLYHSACKSLTAKRDLKLEGEQPKSTKFVLENNNVVNKMYSDNTCTTEMTLSEEQQKQSVMECGSCKYDEEEEDSSSMKVVCSTDLPADEDNNDEDKVEPTNAKYVVATLGFSSDVIVLNQCQNYRDDTKTISLKYKAKDAKTYQECWYTESDCKGTETCEDEIIYEPYAYKNELPSFAVKTINDLASS